MPSRAHASRGDAHPSRGCAKVPGPQRILAAERPWPAGPPPSSSTRRAATRSSSRSPARCRERSSAAASGPAIRSPATGRWPTSSGVSRNTVMAAFRELQDQGWVVSTPGEGSKVAAAPPLPRRGAAAGRGDGLRPRHAGSPRGPAGARPPAARRLGHPRPAPPAGRGAGPRLPPRAHPQQAERPHHGGRAGPPEAARGAGRHALRHPRHRRGARADHRHPRQPDGLLPRRPRAGGAGRRGGGGGAGPPQRLGGLRPRRGPVPGGPGRPGRARRRRPRGAARRSTGCGRCWSRRSATTRRW